MKVDKEYWDADKETLVLCGELDNIDIKLKFAAKLISAYIFDQNNNPSTWYSYSKNVTKFIVEYMYFIDYHVRNQVFKSIVVSEGQCFPTIVIVNVPKKWFDGFCFKNMFNPKKAYLRNIDIGY